MLLRHKRGGAEVWLTALAGDWRRPIRRTLCSVAHSSPALSTWTVAGTISGDYPQSTGPVITGERCVVVFGTLDMSSAMLNSHKGCCRFTAILITHTVVIGGLIYFFRNDRSILWSGSLAVSGVCFSWVEGHAANRKILEE